MLFLAADRSRATLTVALVALLTGIFALVMTDSGHGQQEQARPRTMTRSPAGPAEYSARGDFPARIQLGGQGELYLENVVEVSLRRDWAILRHLEKDDGKIATLLVPREAVGFLKVWEDLPAGN